MRLSKPLCSELVYFFHFEYVRSVVTSGYFDHHIFVTSVWYCMSQSLSYIVFVCCVSFISIPEYFVSFSDYCRMFDALLFFVVFCKYWRQLFLIIGHFCFLSHSPPPLNAFHFSDFSFVCQALHKLRLLHLQYSDISKLHRHKRGLVLCNALLALSRAFKLHQIVFF